MWAVDENGDKYAEITKSELEKIVERMQDMRAEIELLNRAIVWYQVKSGLSHPGFVLEELEP